MGSAARWPETHAGSATSGRRLASVPWLLCWEVEMMSLLPHRLGGGPEVVSPCSFRVLTAHTQQTEE